MADWKQQRRKVGNNKEEGEKKEANKIKKNNPLIPLKEIHPLYNIVIHIKILS